MEPSTDAPARTPLPAHLRAAGSTPPTPPVSLTVAVEDGLRTAFCAVVMHYQTLALEPLPPATTGHQKFRAWQERLRSLENAVHKMRDELERARVVPPYDLMVTFFESANKAYEAAYAYYVFHFGALPDGEVDAPIEALSMRESLEKRTSCVFFLLEYSLLTATF